MSSNRQVSTSPILASHDTRLAIPAAYASIPAAYTATADTNGSSALISNSNSKFLSGTKQQSINDNEEEKAYQAALKNFRESIYCIERNTSSKNTTWLNDKDKKDIEDVANKSLKPLKTNLIEFIQNNRHKDKILCTEVLNTMADHIKQSGNKDLFTSINNGLNDYNTPIIGYIVKIRCKEKSSDSEFLRSVSSCMYTICILSFVVSLICFAMAPLTFGLSFFGLAALTAAIALSASIGARNIENSNINHNSNLTRNLDPICGTTSRALTSAREIYNLFSNHSQNPQGAGTKSVDSNINIPTNPQPLKIVRP